MYRLNIKENQYFKSQKIMFIRNAGWILFILQWSTKQTQKDTSYQFIRFWFHFEKISLFLYPFLIFILYTIIIAYLLSFIGIPLSPLYAKE